MTPTRRRFHAWLHALVEDSEAYASEGLDGYDSDHLGTIHECALILLEKHFPPPKDDP